MPIIAQEYNTPSIDFLYFTGKDGIVYPGTSTTLEVIPGEYVCHFFYPRDLTPEEFWVVKIDTLSIKDSKWGINTQKNQIAIDFTSAQSVWVTLGISSDFSEYTLGSKRPPKQISSTIRFIIPNQFITIPPSNPVPSNSSVSYTNIISDLKNPVIPIIRSSPTPTPSTKPLAPYAPVVSKFTFSTALDSVSPILDTHQLSYTVVKNIINSMDDVSLIYLESVVSGGPVQVKYITKPVKLLEDNLASGFFISFAAYVPEEAGVFVFYKIYNTVEDDSTDTLETQPWIFCGTTGTRKSLDKHEFLDFEFQLDSISYLKNNAITHFDMFSIKIVLVSTNVANTPKVKDFRVMAHS